MRGRVEPVPAISLLGGACMSYTFSLSRRSLPVRCLCLLLIVLVLWCFFMVPRAGAVALEATTIAYGGLLVGTILVGGGVVFSSHGDMAKVGAAMYKTMSDGGSAIASKIAAISSWAVEHGEKIGSAALRIGKELYQGIVDAFNASYSDGHFNVSPDGAVHSFEDYDSLYAYLATLSLGSPVHLYARRYLNDKWVTWHSYWRYYLVGTKLCYDSSEGVLGSEPAVKAHEWEDLGAVPTDVKIRDAGGYGATGHSIEATFEFESKSDKKFIFTFSQEMHNLYPSYRVGSAQSYPVAGDDLAYPSDDYLVRMPDIPAVDTATGDVTYPNDTAYTKDAVAVPYPVDTEGVKVPDIPYDKVVDQSTGKALDDTGTDTDNPSKPGEGADTGSNTGLLQKILDLLKNFFDSPSDFRLNMDGFRNLAIKDKFPFCIPFDMVDSVKQFAADAADYQFRVKLDTQYFKVDHVVDLTPLAVPLAFFRYLVVAWFAWVLMSRTHDLMKW